MAAMAEIDADETIILDICDSESIKENYLFTDNLTQDEKEEICNIVQQIDGVNSRELIDFTSQEFTIPGKLANPHHKSVSTAELDCLANKNSTENTQYQTKFLYISIKI